MEKIELSCIKQSLLRVKRGLILNSQARALLVGEFYHLASEYRENLESRIGDEFDTDLSRKIDSLSVALGEG